MRKGLFKLGIALGVIQLPVTWFTGIMAWMVDGSAPNTLEAFVAISVFVITITINVALPLYICKKAQSNALLFPSFQKIPLPLLFIFLIIVIGYFIYAQM